MNYGAFKKAKYLEKIVIPNKVLEIDASTFASCNKLKIVTLPKNLNFIGYRAFYKCTNLKNISLPKNLHSIGDEAFYKCTNLKNISLPKNPNPSMHIGVKVFEGCKNLKNIQLPKTLIMYRYSPYYNIFKDCKSLTKLELPEGVEKFSINNIAGCKKLKKLIFKNPYCKIINTTEIKWNYGQVIYGYDNSTAEKFAKKNGLKFKSLGNRCTTVMNLDINSTNKKNKIQLTWKKVKGAKYYQIYQSTDGKKWKRISSQKGTKYTVKNLKDKKTYYFKVRAAKNRNTKYPFGIIKDITM